MKHPEIWESFRTFKKFQKQVPGPGVATRDEKVPLSFQQQRLWLLSQLNPGGSEFNVPYAFKLVGSLDHSALSKALTEIYRRHEALRTRFSNAYGGCQIIDPPSPRALPLTDLSQADEDDRAQKIAAIIAQEAKKPFSLQEGPLMRASLMKVAPDTHIFLITFHHIVYDAWSDGVFFKELGKLYQDYIAGADPELKAPHIQYADYAIWQTSAWQEAGYLETLTDYWREALEDIESQPFPADFPRQGKPGKELGKEVRVLPTSLSADIKALAGEEEVSNFVILLGAFYALLNSYLEKDDLFVSAPIANRLRPEVQSLIGYFVNFVIYRTRFDSSSSFSELINKVCKVTSGAYAHQEMPVEQLIEEFGLFDLNLSQLMFSVQNADRCIPAMGELEVTPLEEQRGTDFDIFMEIEELDEGLVINLRYNTDLFAPGSMAQLVDDYLTIINAVILDTETPVNQLLVIDGERRAELQEKLARAANEAAPRQAASSDYLAPRDEVETTLVAIWEKLLGRDNIGVRDNFFELGGKSLVALQLVDEIDVHLDKQLPVSVLAEAQTIEEIAALLRRDFAHAPVSGIVPLQPQGVMRPLFLLQPAACTPLHYAELARKLAPNQPVYGFEQRGMDGKEQPHQTVREMAAHYIQEMKTVAPEGPYQMLGRCMGGIVAYEMAVQLQAQGEEVSFLGILDTQSPPRLTPRDWKYYAAELVKRVVHYAREGKLIKGFVGLYMKKARRRQSEDPGERLLQHVMDTHARARRHYIPAPLFEGEVTIFKNTEASLEAQEGWTALAPGGLQTIEAPGDHQTMLEGEHVGAFVEVLTSALHAERDDSAAENIDYSESEQSAA